MLTSADIRRRWWGMFFLVGALLLLLWGQTALRGHLEGYTYLFYWLGCLTLASLAFLTALLDLWIVRRRARLKRKELVDRLLRDGQSMLREQQEKQQTPEGPPAESS